MDEPVAAVDEATAARPSKPSATRRKKSLYLMVARPKPTTKAIEIERANKVKNAQRPHKRPDGASGA